MIVLTAPENRILRLQRTQKPWLILKYMACSVHSTRFGSLDALTFPLNSVLLFPSILTFLRAEALVSASASSPPNILFGLLPSMGGKAQEDPVLPLISSWTS